MNNTNTTNEGTMQYKLLKDKINEVGFYYQDKNNPNILNCIGFSLMLQTHRDQLDLLPDVVEEFIPELITLFDDDELVHPKSGDFFFKCDKMVRRDFDTGKYVVKDIPHYIHIGRSEVTPLTV